MEQRIFMEKAQPEAWKALYGFSLSIKNPALTPIQKHLIKIRASLLNSCAFCINMHTKEALHSGETQQRIFLISAWRETSLFTEEEKALLAIVEEVTLISEHGVSDEVYKKAQQFFSDQAISEIIIDTVIINAWNRIAVSTHQAIVNL